jgi:hypothetical protein
MSKEITVIKEVFPKPLRIFCGFKRLLLLSSRYGKTEKKISKNVKITIDLKTIENLSIE